MLVLKESIHVERSLIDAFEYTSDFSHIQAWDPGVVSSFKIRPDETGIGSQFDLILRFGLFRPAMKYETIEYEPYSRVVLSGKGDSFSAVDTILFAQTDKGTRIDYQAEIRFFGFGRHLERFLSPLMRNIGKKAMSGLKQTLDGTSPLFEKKGWFKSGSGLVNYFADHSVIPGGLMFSRFGYDLSQRFWTESCETLYAKEAW